MSDPKKFATDVSTLISKMKVAPDIFLRKFTLDLFTAVVLRTPVDTGLLRGNWQPSIGSPRGGRSTVKDKSGQAAIARVRGTTSQVTWGTDVYLMNNLPYAAVVEFGGYPDPVKKGTYVPAGTSKYGINGPGFVKRSAGGFSRQAPSGMVRVSIADAQRWVTAALDAVKRGEA